AALWALHNVSDDSDPMAAKEIRGIRRKGFQTRDVHIGPVAAFFVQQLVAKEVRERRAIAAGANARVFVDATTLEHRATRQYFRRVFEHDPARQRRGYPVVSP